MFNMLFKKRQQNYRTKNLNRMSENPSYCLYNKIKKNIPLIIFYDIIKEKERKFYGNSYNKMGWW